MKRLLVSIIFVIPLFVYSQINRTNCTQVAINTFQNYLEYYDTAKYSMLNTNIMSDEHCVRDTLSLINGLMSIRFVNIEQTRLAVSNKLDLKYYQDYLERKINKRYSSSNVIAPSSRPYPREVLKLYFIYALYKNDFEFADSVSLKSINGQVLVYNKKFRIQWDSSITKRQQEKNTKRSFHNYKLLKQAEDSYEKWLIDLNRLGMAEMRRRNLHPLYWSNLTW